MDRLRNSIQSGLLGIGVALLPFMLALLFNAGAEAFFGDKEPMFQTLFGLLVGILLACGLAIGIPALGRNGFRKTAWALLIVLLALDASAIPLSRWLIQTARASPTHVIELW